MKVKLTHGSLFSGIGGFDLAAEWMGWENKFHCEWNPFGQKILKYYWPNATSYEDITKTDFTIHEGRIDILTGGFPCQPYSTAGKRKGNADERHLWPEMLRAIREIKPTWIVGENVLGIVNWNGGMVFEEVQTDLEAEGYEVQPFILPACSVNAPHRRDRVWFVAYSNSGSTRSPGTSSEAEGKRSKNDDEQSERRKTTKLRFGHGNVLRIDSNANSDGLYRSDGKHEIKSSETGIDALSDIKQGTIDGNFTNSSILELQGSKFNGSLEETRSIEGQSGQSCRSIPSTWKEFPTQSPICDGNDGIPTELDSITISKWRTESIKAGGNAIVPQVVFQIFKTINEWLIFNNK